MSVAEVVRSNEYRVAGESPVTVYSLIVLASDTEFEGALSDDQLRMVGLAPVGGSQYKSISVSVMSPMTSSPGTAGSSTNKV